MNQETTYMTELEERLAAPDGEAHRAQLLSRLAELELLLRRRLAGLVPRAEFARLSAGAEAARVAQETLRHWPVGNKRSTGAAHAASSAGQHPSIFLK